MSDAGIPVLDGAGAMRVLGAQRPLVLAARAAARAMSGRAFKCMPKRLLPRPTSFSRTSGWMPVLLRWVRQAALWSRALVRAPALPASSTIHFHWHLQLAALAGSDRGRREARTTAVTDAFPMGTQANRMNPPSAERMAGIGYRRHRGPADPIEGARATPARPRSASIGLRWRWEAADSGRAELPRVPAAQSFLAGARPQSGARSFDQGQVAGLNAAGGALSASASMTPRPPMAAPAVTKSARRSIDAHARAASEECLRPALSPVTPTLLRPKRALPAPRAFASSRPPAAGRPPGERTWRTSDPASTARYSSRHAAPRLVPGIAVRRSVDLVWPASPARSAPSDAMARGATSAAPGASSMPSIQAVAQAPMGSSRARDNAVVRATALDPVLADRLADEVMRRIDHRARIDRERRGL